jgi:hypothetical protein
LALLHGWVAVAALNGLVLLQSWALWRLAGGAHGHLDRRRRWVGRLYASLPALLAGGATLSEAVGCPLPELYFPWIGGTKHLNLLYALGWLTGTVLGLSRNDGAPGSERVQPLPPEALPSDR